MSTADRLRATGQKFTRASAATEPAVTPAEDSRPVEAAPPARNDTVRVQKVRLSVDVPSGRHQSLQDWCIAESRARGYRVSANMLMNALAAEFLAMSDATIAATIGQRPELDRQDPPRGRRK